jgi:hypothetical protein
MARQQSRGQCVYCEQTYAKSGMSRHLTACEKRKAAMQEPLGKGRGKARATKIFHIQVEGTYLPMYWMHVEIPADATLAFLDAFLRDVWLECCGHLSAFKISDTFYTDQSFGEIDFMEGDIETALGDVLKSGMTFEHEYDFGTTTELTLKVVGEREGQARGQTVQVMARNDPPPWVCEVCGKPATQVCVQCTWDDEGWLCDKCAPKHKCGEDMLLPVVNSPRVGMCGYTGETGWE